MAAAAIGVVFRAWNFPNGGGGFKGVKGDITSAATAVRRPDIASGDLAYYRYVLIVCAIMFGLVLLHLAAKPGRAWAAIRQSEPSALAGGVNIVQFKLWAWALASFITGVAGCLLGIGWRRHRQLGQLQHDRLGHAHRRRAHGRRLQRLGRRSRRGVPPVPS